MLPSRPHRVRVESDDDDAVPWLQGLLFSACVDRAERAALALRLFDHQRDSLRLCRPAELHRYCVTDAEPRLSTSRCGSRTVSLIFVLESQSHARFVLSPNTGGLMGENIVRVLLRRFDVGLCREQMFGSTCAQSKNIY